MTSFTLETTNFATYCTVQYIEMFFFKSMPANYSRLSYSARPSRGVSCGPHRIGSPQRCWGGSVTRKVVPSLGWADELAREPSKRHNKSQQVGHKMALKAPVQYICCPSVAPSPPRSKRLSTQPLQRQQRSAPSRVTPASVTPASVSSHGLHPLSVRSPLLQ